MPEFMERVAAAPISWGICEAPGWGLQLSVDRVLSEASSLGISAFEQGSLGWLPTGAVAQRETLARYGMELIGGFVALVLHDATQREAMLGRAERVAADMAACGGSMFISAAVASLDDWHRPELTEREWSELFANLAAVDRITAAHGLTQVLHPHIDTLIESAEDFSRFLAETEVLCCLDTGHLMIGGTDPVAICRGHRERVGLVHLKDVDGPVAARERSGELSLFEATRAGLFPSLGDGMVPIAEVVECLEASGYEGWYVMETDVALLDEPLTGEGPVRGVARSLEYLNSLAGSGATR